MLAQLLTTIDGLFTTRKPGFRWQLSGMLCGCELQPARISPDPMGWDPTQCTHATVCRAAAANAREAALERSRKAEEQAARLAAQQAELEQRLEAFERQVSRGHTERLRVHAVWLPLGTGTAWQDQRVTAELSWCLRNQATGGPCIGYKCPAKHIGGLVHNR